MVARTPIVYSFVQFPVSVDVVSDTALCIGSELVLDALGAETYQWTEASLDLSQAATLVYPVTEVHPHGGRFECVL